MQFKIFVIKNYSRGIRCEYPDELKAYAPQHTRIVTTNRITVSFAN